MHLATFVNDATVLAFFHKLSVSSKHLENNINRKQNWFKYWKIKGNENVNQYYIHYEKERNFAY